MQVYGFVPLRGKGEARFAKLAFDRALEAAGIKDMNLVSVSSILPQGAVLLESFDFSAVPKGSIVFGVFDWLCSCKEGKKLLVGLGLSQFADGWGVVIEHKAEDCERAEFEQELAEMLDDLVARRKAKEVRRLYILEEGTVRNQWLCVFAGVAFVEKSWCGGRDLNPGRH
ncbi:MAG: hypothetical protein GXO42_00580 [bacterium]|nr:hypothetical protein [bacterium]